MKGELNGLSENIWEYRVDGCRFAIVEGLDDVPAGGTVTRYWAVQLDIGRAPTIDNHARRLEDAMDACDRQAVRWNDVFTCRGCDKTMSIECNGRHTINDDGPYCDACYY